MNFLIEFDLLFGIIYVGEHRNRVDFYVIEHFLQIFLGKYVFNCAFLKC